MPEVPRDLLRQWWYLYAQVLRPEGMGSAKLWREFKEIDGQVGAFVTSGPMPRTGAEDLADICDEIRGYPKRLCR